MPGLKIVIPLCFLGLAICSPHLASAQRRVTNNHRRAEQDIINNLLDPKTYDSRINPGGNDTESPTVVAVNFYVRQLDLAEVRGEMKIQLILRMEWNDHRLTYSRPHRDGKRKFLSVPVEDAKKVWIPEYFVSSEMESKIHTFPHSNSYLRIFPDGTVKTSVLTSLNLSCHMTFRNFPFDSQACTLRLASYGYSEEDIKFIWNKSQEPMHVNSVLQSGTKFELNNFYPEFCTSQTSTGLIYSCLRAEFSFKRLTNYYLIQIFIPCTMLIIIAWFVFWLAPKDIVARLILVVGTLLVMVMQITKLNEQLPQVPYTRAIDIWTGISLAFVFVALLETIMANYLSRYESKNDGDRPLDTGRKEGNADPGAGQMSVKLYSSRIDLQSWSQKTDIFFRIVYPVAFTVFVFSYYSHYCTE